MINFVLPTARQDCNKCILVDQECVFVSRKKYYLNLHCVLEPPPTNTLTCQYTGLFTYKVNVKQRENPFVSY